MPQTSTATASTATALVLFSGGQDSTTCLAWALERYARVETVGFNYRQRHAIEMTCRTKVLSGLREKFPHWRSRIGEDHVLDLGVLADVGDSALTQQRTIEYGNNGLPNTFVPGRNLIFLSLAAALAYRHGISVLIGGMCQTDYSGYPDCRDDTLTSLQTTLCLGMDTRFEIEAPLMWLDKAGIWKLARNLGGEALIEIIIQDTHTCYLGERLSKHAWGYGCGRCPACDLRTKGFEAYVRP